MGRALHKLTHTTAHDPQATTATDRDMLAIHPALDLHPFGMLRSPLFNMHKSMLADLARLPRDTAEATLSETDSGYVMQLTAPGVHSQDLKVSLDGATLTVAGETKTETRHFSFQRSVTLPRDADVAADDVIASLADGVLTVKVPKGTVPQPRKLEVCAGAAAALPEAGQSEEAPEMY